uniref:C4-dicarboxylate transporter n=1 Tax=Thermogemmatispora argillosa TaxID=2045280 RepID=A0A455SWU5_9CHLR|nr:C4-dicarboxylate transporter [Thermogemmatispora argillosa]
MKQGSMSVYQASWWNWVRQLYPGYFACVMATGIVSIALLLNQAILVSVILGWLGGGLFLLLLALYLLRLIRYPRAVLQDATDPSKLFGYFTAVAAPGVLATRAALSHWVGLPVLLTALAAGIWCFLTYWAFAVLLFHNARPLQQTVNGSWLISIVGTESLAINGTLLASIWPEQAAVLQLVAYAFWTLGVLLYLIFITFIVYRFFFGKILPADLTPPYWINMGAMAITTVAGIRLLQAPHPAPLLVGVRSYLTGFTLMMWAWGTWWLPLLVLIGIWKYGIMRQPLRYEPALWSIVFPLGMYATALHLLGQLPGIAFFEAVAVPFTWVAFVAWLLVMGGWFLEIGRTLRRLRACAQTRETHPLAVSEREGPASRLPAEG